MTLNLRVLNNDKNILLSLVPITKTNEMKPPMVLSYGFCGLFTKAIFLKKYFFHAALSSIDDCFEID